MSDIFLLKEALLHCHQVSVREKVGEEGKVLHLVTCDRTRGTQHVIHVYEQARGTSRLLPVREGQHCSESRSDQPRHLLSKQHHPSRQSDDSARFQAHSSASSTHVPERRSQVHSSFCCGAVQKWATRLRERERDGINQVISFFQRFCFLVCNSTMVLARHLLSILV